MAFRRWAVTALTMVSLTGVGSGQSSPLGKSVEITLNPQEQQGLRQICEAARYGNRMMADPICLYFERKIATAPEKKVNTPSELPGNQIAPQSE
jgi:hypothetical protein